MNSRSPVVKENQENQENQDKEDKEDKENKENQDNQDNQDKENQDNQVNQDKEVVMSQIRLKHRSLGRSVVVNRVRVEEYQVVMQCSNWKLATLGVKVLMNHSWKHNLQAEAVPVDWLD